MNTVTRATPPATPRPDPRGPICGRPRTNGEPCRRPAGWGADPGEKHCRDHGGSIAERIAAKERLVEQALMVARTVLLGSPVFEVPDWTQRSLRLLDPTSVDGGV